MSHTRKAGFAAIALVAVTGAITTVSSWNPSANTDASTSASTAPTEASAANLNASQSVRDGNAALARIRVAPADTGAHYDREDWLKDWPTVAPNCSLREKVLKDSALVLKKGHPFGPPKPGSCVPTRAYWVSPYDNASETDPSKLDIDHIVPLGEVAVSGTRKWTDQQRHAYATDPAVLVAVSARSNRQKSDQDPAHWLPDPYDRCNYVVKYAQIKAKYGMTADRAEMSAMRNVLAHCPQGSEQ